ncbi:MAG: HAMP domain-containing protein [Bacteroidales bacterium]|nr:HAMP domain-containing protein [Bacteroidales bacterium]
MKTFIKNIKITHIIIFMTILTTSIISVQSYNSISSLGKARDYIQLLHSDRIKPVTLLNGIMNNYGIVIVDAANKIHNNSISWESGANDIKVARLNIQKLWQDFYNTDKDETTLLQAQGINKAEEKVNVTLDKLERVIFNKNEIELEKFIESELYTAIEPLTKLINKAIVKQNSMVDDIISGSETLYSSSLNKARNIGLIAVIIIVGLAIFIVTTLGNTLKTANATIRKIASGDLTVEIEGYGNDEIGELLHNIKGLVQNLRSILEVINTAGNNIAITSHEMSTSSQQISQGSTEQAASVEEMAASMEEISANIIQNAKNAQVTQQISVQAGKEYETGIKNIDTTVNAIQSIASKITIIGEIAFQTNILALNAAVEAARAGEHGKGFGVVASEVGKLAERSKVAAAEIEALSKSGVNLSLKSKELLDIALPTVNKTINLVKEISLSSSDQSSGVDQINTGIQTLNHVTQQNAAASEEMATVAQELAAQAEQLKNTISFFKIGKEQKTDITPNSVVSKFIEQKSPVKMTEKPSKPKGFKIDLDSRDDLDDEFETF